MELATAVIELGVGAGCMAIALAGWRRGGPVWVSLSVLVAAAGGAAVLHAVIALVRSAT